MTRPNFSRKNHKISLHMSTVDKPPDVVHENFEFLTAGLHDDLGLVQNVIIGD